MQPVINSFCRKPKQTVNRLQSVRHAFFRFHFPTADTHCIVALHSTFSIMHASVLPAIIYCLDWLHAKQRNKGIANFSDGLIQELTNQIPASQALYNQILGRIIHGFARPHFCLSARQMFYCMQRQPNFHARCVYPNRK